MKKIDSAFEPFSLDVFRSKMNKFRKEYFGSDDELLFLYAFTYFQAHKHH